jgi:hypothetical protein
MDEFIVGGSIANDKAEESKEVTTDRSGGGYRRVGCCNICYNTISQLRRGVAARRLHVARRFTETASATINVLTELRQRFAARSVNIHEELRRVAARWRAERA